MTQEEIIEGNKLIAEFMGAEFDMGHYHVTDSYTKPDGEKVFKYQQGTAFYDVGQEPSSQKGGYPITIIKYHTSWDWLMPVAKKVIETYTGGMDVYSLYVSDSLRTAIIEEVWASVVEFIKWYNENK